MRERKRKERFDKADQSNSPSELWTGPTEEEIKKEEESESKTHFDMFLKKLKTPEAAVDEK